jgi:hypothetical protein
MVALAACCAQFPPRKSLFCNLPRDGTTAFIVNIKENEAWNYPGDYLLESWFFGCSSELSHS